jgi:phospholipid/cholesterol/gamma-HCH transport system substrate-binding protein
MPRFGEREDIILGACILVLGAGILSWVHSAEPVSEEDNGLTLYANFQHTDGLTEGADVRLSGINVGLVTNMSLNSKYKSEVIMRLNDDIRVPSDSAAVIHTDGLFGGKYIEIEPGGSFDTLADGETVAYTQDSLIVEDLLARLTAIAKSRDTQCEEVLSREKNPSPSTPSPSEPQAPSLLLPLSEGNF